MVIQILGKEVWSDVKVSEYLRLIRYALYSSVLNLSFQTASHFMAAEIDE